MGLLWSQFALAAYACQGMDTGMGGNNSPARMPPCPDCEQMAQAEPALCLGHCLGQHAALDKAEPPVVLAPAPLAVLQLAYQPGFLAISLPRPEPSALTARAGAPPLAVWHCCFRI